MLEFIYKLRELEQYFVSCRRLLNFGHCLDQFYSALRSLQLYDPVIRMTTSTSKLWLSLQLFSEHLLWLSSMGLLKDTQEGSFQKFKWVHRSNKFLLYSISCNLLRDFYELINIIQFQRVRREKNSNNLESDLLNFSLKTPIDWIKKYPKLSCDLIKNLTDFIVPYSAINKIDLPPVIIATLGITSTTMGILQIYDKSYRLSTTTTSISSSSSS